jgi:hypothetical protein
MHLDSIISAMFTSADPARIAWFHRCALFRPGIASTDCLMLLNWQLDDHLGRKRTARSDARQRYNYASADLYRPTELLRWHGSTNMDANEIKPRSFYWVSTPKGELKIVVMARALIMTDGWQCRLPEGHTGIVVFKSTDFLRPAEN